MALAKNKTVIILVGATATGKTAIAVELAKHFKTEIISADSRQCFKELNIGVARPSGEELRTVRHHFIASHSIHGTINAGTFENFALHEVSELFQKHDAVIMTGGTGLYVKAFAEGMDQIPEVPDKIRQEIISGYEKQGLQWLQNEVERKDPAYFKIADTQNPQRLMRALEVSEATGESILNFQKGKKEERDFKIVKIGLELPKDDLHTRIHLRVDKMIENGLVEEARELLPFKNLNALQTVGYSEIFDYLDAKISLEEAIELIKKNTRQYAKRQVTWFKKDKEIKWFAPKDIEEIKNYLTSLAI
jgi:tRNA dimethylallyltransferase